MPAEVGKIRIPKSENQNSELWKTEVKTSEFQNLMILIPSEPEFSDTDFSLEEEEEKAPQNPEGKNRATFLEKLIKATKYDRDYIWNLVH